MKEEAEPTKNKAMAEAISYLSKSVNAKKCWSCGCFHSFLKAIDTDFPESGWPPEFEALIRTGREKITDVAYDCLGCEVCFPPTVLNILIHAGIIKVLESSDCFSEKVQEREGWPPLPGSYKVLRYHAPVAICTLTDEELLSSLAQSMAPEIALVGSLQTENLGIERLVQNVLANPNIRFLIICGADSKKAVGHLPGRSLLALARRGIDESNRIIEAPGKRPMLHNISKEAVEHFRKTVEVVDLIGNADSTSILEMASECAARNPGPGEPFASKQVINPITGYVPKRMTSDPSGYFVIHIDKQKGIIWLEHYRNDGVLDSIIQGSKAVELYFPAIDKGLLSRLDHAAYLGGELARAEQSLISGEPYIQDRAPEEETLPVVQNIECGPTCSCKRSIS